MEFIFRLDYDNITCFQLETYLDVILKIGKRRIKKIRSRLSAGGHGFHVEVTIQIPDSLLKTIPSFNSFILGIRYAFNDCFGRVKGDIARMKLDKRVDRLADYKDGKYASEWKTEYSGGKNET